VQLIT